MPPSISNYNPMIPLRNMTLYKSFLSAALLISSVSASAQSERWLADSLPRNWQMTPQYSQTLPNSDEWWESFNDPVLNSLIDKAVANNYNVAAALKRIEMARKSILETKAGYFPTISLSGGWNKSRSAGAMQSSDAPSSNMSYFSLGADMNWEIDIFGKVRKVLKAKKQPIMPRVRNTTE